jgi:hypothetical protein
MSDKDRDAAIEYVTHKQQTIIEATDFEMVITSDVFRNLTKAFEGIYDTAYDAGREAERREIAVEFARTLYDDIAQVLHWRLNKADVMAAVERTVKAIGKLDSPAASSVCECGQRQVKHYEGWGGCPVSRCGGYRPKGQGQEEHDEQH